MEDESKQRQENEKIEQQLLVGSMVVISHMGVARELNLKPGSFGTRHSRDQQVAEHCEQASRKSKVQSARKIP